MANVVYQKGLSPIRTRDGSPFNEQINPYFINSSYGTALFVGDPIVKTGTSNTAAAGQSKQYAPGVLPEINKATAGTTNPVTGVIVAFEPNPNGLATIYNPASTECVAWVCDGPDVIYEIQADSQVAIAATDIGSNANLIYSTGGNTSTGLSGAQLDTSSMTTTAAYQLKILRLVDRLDNALGLNAKLEVMLNNDTEINGTAGI